MKPDTAGNTPELVIKIPVVVEARQFTEEMAWAYLSEKTPLPPGVKFCSASYHRDDHRLDRFRAGVTVAGGTLAMLEFGDWILRDPNTGDAWPIKPDIFAATYERVAAPSQEAQGSWPLGVHRAFVAGADWWQWHANKATMFASERDEAEAEAVRKFGPVGAEPLASQEAAPPAWMKLPDEQAWYWWWNGEDYDVPYICSVLLSKTGVDRYFVADGKNAPWCDEMGGWWLKIARPNVPSREWQKSSAEPAPSPATKDTPWKNAVEEACIVNHISFYPVSAGLSLANLINWEVSVALDPKVSKAAQDLFDAGAKSISQGPAREETTCETRAHAKELIETLDREGMLVTVAERFLTAYDHRTCCAGAQSRTPTNVESRTEPDDLRIWAHTESLRADVAEARLKDLESRTVAPQLDHENKLRAIVRWLEANQPDVFKRGLWEAIDAACVAGRESRAAEYVRLSGKKIHTNDCATSIAPAEEPGPCDCTVAPQPELADDVLLDKIISDIEYARKWNKRDSWLGLTILGHLEGRLAGAAALPSETDFGLLVTEEIGYLHRTFESVSTVDFKLFEGMMRRMIGRLFRASVPAASSPTPDEHAVLQAALDWNEEYKFLNHLVGNPYWVAWANTLGMKGQYMPSPHTPKEMGHKPAVKLDTSTDWATAHARDIVAKVNESLSFTIDYGSDKWRSLIAESARKHYAASSPEPNLRHDVGRFAAWMSEAMDSKKIERDSRNEPQYMSADYPITDAIARLQDKTDQLAYDAAHRPESDRVRKTAVHLANFCMIVALKLELPAPPVAQKDQK